MAGKSGSGQVFTSPKSTNISQSNANCASRHKNYPFNHSSSYTPHHNITTGAGATHHHQTHPHLYSNFTPSSSSPSFPTSSSFSHLRPHSPSKLSSSRINSSSSLSSSFNYNSPLSKSGTPAPSPGAFVSPLASIGKINYSAPGTCSMFYKNALKKKKKKNSSSSTRENRNRDSSPVHPSALVSYLRDSPPRGYDEDFDSDDFAPVAPSMEFMVKIPGYEAITFNAITVPPPNAVTNAFLQVNLPKLPIQQKKPVQAVKMPASPTIDVVSDEEMQQSHTQPGLLTFTHSFIPSAPELTKQEARVALLNYASNRYCYKTKVAKQMSITKIENLIASHYTLESFTEKRQVNWSYEPYTGGSIDSLASPIELNPPPDPWSVEVKPTEDFSTNCIVTKVPHTELIKVCNACGGAGRNKCNSCNAVGWKVCLTCNGDGYKPHPLFIGETEKCYHCNITGSRRCSRCTGDRFTPCKGCKGKGQIRCYIKLSVHFTNHLEEYIHIQSNPVVPVEQIKLATGNMVYESVHPTVQPISHYPEASINMASKQIHLKHSDLVSSNDCRLIAQRQRVRIIPVAKVHYEWKSRPGHFYVYGFEKRVHAPDYPQKSCCCLL